MINKKFKFKHEDFQEEDDTLYQAEYNEKMNTYTITWLWDGLDECATYSNYDVDRYLNDKIWIIQ